MPDPIEPYDSLFKPCRQPSKSQKTGEETFMCDKGFDAGCKGCSDGLVCPEPSTTF